MDKKLLLSCSKPLKISSKCFYWNRPTNENIFLYCFHGNKMNYVSYYHSGKVFLSTHLNDNTDKKEIINQEESSLTINSEILIPTQGNKKAKPKDKYPFGLMKNVLLRYANMNLERKIASAHLKYYKRNSPFCMKNQCDSLLSDESAPEPMSVKELFNHNLLLKYQMPSNNQVKRLLLEYPEPVKLFFDVMKPLIEADPSLTSQLIVSRHLKNIYWKAQLNLRWQNSICVTGVNSDRDLAIEHAFLLACVQLQFFGLLSKRNNGLWGPTECDKIASVLELLAKYGESTLSGPHGRGFKVIMEKCQIKKSPPKNDNLDTTEAMESQIQSLRHNQNFQSDNVNKHTYPINIEFCHYFYQLYNTHKTSKHVWTDLLNCVSFAHSNSNKVEIGNNFLSTSLVGPKWSCTVHVGWPVPFTVQEKGVSLPSAQKLGYLAVATKLKMLKLLNHENEINFASLTHHFNIDTIQTWIKNKNSMNLKIVECFTPEATIFTDASVTGFGAYLIMEERDKISWMSEDWATFGHLKDIVHPNNSIDTTMAELIALVTAISSWKCRLRGKRVLCFSDNSAVVTLINSVSSSRIDLQASVCTIDRIIHSLKSNCGKYDISLQTSWIDREDNLLADLLSRSLVSTFKMHVPKAEVAKSKIKQVI
ncbi:uncharacterized protein LOC131939480 [Physella acuta]|uniref:uncharacterized protein LOC131939480 n=1 Tax=Physella acuta TaxID=109671 RepID=UPI0027DAD1F0|nr:uncharacterized protein LOC131939480 [Physella acuta]